MLGHHPTTPTSASERASPAASADDVAASTAPVSATSRAHAPTMRAAAAAEDTNEGPAAASPPRGRPPSAEATREGGSPDAPAAAPARIDTAASPGALHAHDTAETPPTWSRSEVPALEASAMAASAMAASAMAASAMAASPAGADAAPAEAALTQALRLYIQGSRHEHEGNLHEAMISYKAAFRRHPEIDRVYNRHFQEQREALQQALSIPSPLLSTSASSIPAASGLSSVPSSSASTALP
ncbi:hypothetical protein CXG81DRAFT_28745, partial [Caulochytrium protostelioides]